MNNITNKDKAISAWWILQGVAFIIFIIVNVIRQTKTPTWAFTFAIIFCVAAYLRFKGNELKRIADMVLLAYSISFAILACVLIYINAHGTAFHAALIIIAAANIAASITSLRRKTKNK